MTSKCDLTEKQKALANGAFAKIDRGLYETDLNALANPARLTDSERIRFSITASPETRRVASAMFARFEQLGIRPPFEKNDTAWCDLADIAIKASKSDV